MKITPIEHDLGLALSTVPRTAGLHMSDIYGSLYEELEPNRFKKDGEPPLLKWELGMTFETVLEEALRTRLQEGSGRPGEFVTEEGIIYSPDLLIFNGATRLGEIKLTFMSNRQGIEDPKFDKWFTQMKAYCYHLDTPYARLYAVFIAGNYRPPAPQLQAWDIEFTKRELEENWQMLKMHALKKGMITL